MIEHVAGPILQDPSALAWSDERGVEHGMPDADRIKEAAEALAAEKPTLARVGGGEASRTVIHPGLRSQPVGE